MRNRKVQRELHRMGVRRMTNEEKIELRDKCGMKDPTPYEAVKHMVQEQERINERIARAAVAAREKKAMAAAV